MKKILHIFNFIFLLSPLLFATYFFGNDSNYRDSIALVASGLKAPGSNPATYVDYGLNGAYSFSGNLDEVVSGAIGIPAGIDISSTTSLRIAFATPATTGTVIFKIEYSFFTQGDNTNTTTPEGIIYSTTTITTSASAYNRIEVNLTGLQQNDSIFIIKITRMGSADTVNDAVYLFGIRLFFYRNFRW